MAARSWIDQLPAESAAVEEFPDVAADEVELRDVAVVRARLSRGNLVSKPELVNVRLRDVDVAGFAAREGRADRVLVDAGRLRGVVWANGVLRDVELRGVRGDDLSVRFSTLRRVVFRDCELAGLDLTESVLDDVRFERCRLPGVRFHRAQVKTLRIEGCDLAGASGVEALAGASVHPDDLLGLAPSMAAALGLTVE